MRQERQTGSLSELRTQGSSGNMLSYILAVAVLIGSFIFYMAAFFFPEVHRKGDFIWSGVGLFYALVLWFCAGRMTGAVLLGDMASVALVGWLGWQTLKLRREVTPYPEQTKISEPEKLQAGATEIRSRFAGLFKRQPKPTLVIDRKGKQKEEATAVTATPPTPAEIVAAPTAVDAIAPDRDIVEPEEVLAQEGAPVAAVPEETVQEAFVEKLPLFEEVISIPTVEPKEAIEEITPSPTEPTETPVEDLPSAAALPDAATEIQVADEDLPGAAALPGAATEIQVADDDEDFEVEEGFEPEPEETKIDQKAPAAKTESAKGKVKAKPAGAKSGGGIFAPVTGLFASLQSGIGGLFGKKKPKTSAGEKLSSPPASKETADTEEFGFEEEEFPLQMDAVIATTEPVSESLSDEELVAEEESTQEARDMMEEALALEAIAIAISPSTVETVEEDLAEKAAIEQAEATIVVEKVTSALETPVSPDPSPVAPPISFPATEAPQAESVPELIAPNPPSPELVEAARSSASEVQEGAMTKEAIAEIAPEVELAPPAEAPIDVEPEVELAPPAAAALDVEPQEEATPAVESQKSEEQGFSQLIRPKRSEAAVVETDKKSAEATSVPPTDEPATTIEELG